jgi:hypothetical protein
MVFGQLVKNAGTVSPQGGSVLVKAKLEASESDQDYVLVQVADSGSGIAPQDLLNVFSPQSGDHPIKGLAKSGPEISRMKGLIEALGGRTWVDSELGNGATFSVLLPVKALVESGNGRGEVSALQVAIWGSLALLFSDRPAACRSPGRVRHMPNPRDLLRSNLVPVGMR